MTKGEPCLRRALIGQRRRGPGGGGRPISPLLRRWRVPAARLGGGEGDHAKSGVGHRGQQVRRPWRVGQRVRGRRKQEVQGRATAGDRPRERASPSLPGGASREPLPRCPRSPLRPVRASGGSRCSVTGVGIKRDGGKESWSVAGVLLMSGTRALRARTPPPPAGPCRP